MIPWEATSLRRSEHGRERILVLHAHGVPLASARRHDGGEIGIFLAEHAPPWAEDLVREAMEEWERQGLPLPLA